MHSHLIVIESAGVGGSYHAMPYRIAGSMSEAIELMRNYMDRGPANDQPCPDFFLVYPEREGNFLVDPIVFNERAETDDGAIDDYQRFLQETGRI